MVSSDELADYAGTSVTHLKNLADQVMAANEFTRNVYATFNRGSRTIVLPSTALDRATKNWHRSFTRELPYEPPPHVHGFVRGRSTLTNAAEHLGKGCVLRVDLREFFPSISSTRVFEALRGQGFESDAAELCTKIVTVDGHLPIGLATSPLLSNIVFDTTDKQLADFSISEGIGFTRYVDDLTFSGDVGDWHLTRVTEILEALDWTVNDRKTVFMRQGGPQYVTGLYVGCVDQPRIPRRIKRQMRRVCFLIEKFGYAYYMNEFGGNEARMVPNRLFGWARYIAAVEPDVGYPMLQLLSAYVPESHPHGAGRPRVGFRFIRDFDDLHP